MRRRHLGGETAGADRTGGPAGAQSERQLQILTVAAHLFRERGYHATTMDDIGAEAGITGPAIYRHFRNKDELLYTAFWTLGRRVAAAVRQSRDGAPSDPQSQLRALVDAFVRIIIAERDLACVYLFETRHIPIELLTDFRDIEHAWHQQFVDALLAVRPNLGQDRALTLIRAATFMVGSVTLEDPLLDDDALERTLSAALMAVMLHSDDDG